MIIREGPETIAAFIAEPIMGAGGVIDPPVNYFPKVQAVLKKYEILMIADEVVCGFGRTGSWFASTQMGIEPDMMATAKGLTSGYFPMSAAFISDAIWQTLLAGAGEFGGFYHGYTYSGHPAGAAVALANIDILESECLVDNARDVGDYLHRKLRDDILRHPHVGEIRGRGLLAGIQLVVDKDTKTFPEIADKWPAQVSSRARELGVIVRPLATVGSIAISPPLIFTRDDVDTLVNTVMQSLEVLG
jgi:L-2,4-diaminobutyrate transaminase